MPIYEFYCPACNTVFSFFSSTVSTGAKPACPRCARPDLERRPSRFSSPTPGRKEGGEEEEPSPFGDIDEQRMEQAMESMAGEFEGLSEEGADDPRTLARFFRKFTQASGLEAGPRMQEMLQRLEAGEDPDNLDAELGDDIGDDDAALGEFFKLKKAARDRARRPKIDETLYFL